MAHWTETISDQQHIADLVNAMHSVGIVLITMLDGNAVEGVVRNVTSGNNGGINGWKYRGEIEIETTSRQRLILDFLDIKSIVNAWNQSKAEEYQRLGLIQISSIRIQ